jgi:hypothetical protein
MQVILGIDRPVEHASPKAALGRDVGRGVDLIIFLEDEEDRTVDQQPVQSAVDDVWRAK